MDEAPSSPQPPEAGARRARLYGVSSTAENRNRDNVVEPMRCRRANVATGPASADFEHVIDLPLAAWGGLAASFCPFDLSLADVREDGAKVLVLDNAGL